MAEQEIQQMKRQVLGLLAIIGLLLVATLIAVIAVGRRDHVAAGGSA